MTDDELQDWVRDELFWDPKVDSNCSGPYRGLVAGAALNKLAQHGKRVHALLARGGDIAAEGEERLRAGQGSPAAGKLLLQLHLHIRRR
jgi:hypothetical protein